MSIILFFLGTIFGSFLTAFTYRWPRGITTVNDRSKCDKCGKIIYWYDNIPLLSYILLKGRCRNCGKKISVRYPLIELSTGLIFTVSYLFLLKCVNFQNQIFPSPLCRWESTLGLWTLPYLLLLSVISVAIFITDFENQIIPDHLVFSLFVITVVLFIFFRNEGLYEVLLTGFSVSFVFLLLHLITRGRGMGLGDVKLVLPLSLILGWPYVLVWIFLSFIIGAFVGTVLIFFHKTSFGKQIPFGPFLIISFFIILFYGGLLVNYLIPFI